MTAKVSEAAWVHNNSVFAGTKHTKPLAFIHQSHALISDPWIVRRHNLHHQRY
jgi:hypothetical protein